MTKQNPFAPLKSREFIAALAIFIIPSLPYLLIILVGSSTLEKLPQWMASAFIILFLGSLLLAFGFAFSKGYSRWAPPYLGALLVVFTVYGPFWPVVHIVYQGIMRWFGPMQSWSFFVRILYQGIQAALMWSIVLLFAFLLVSLLRIFPRTRTLWEKIRQDWTFLSFFLYGGIVVHIVLIFDEYHHDEPWMLASWVCLGIGCYLYLRAKTLKQRILILLCGASLSMWIIAIGKWFLVPMQTWEPWFERYPTETERWFESLRTLADWLCLILAMLVPALLSFLPKHKKQLPEEKPSAE